MKRTIKLKSCGDIRSEYESAGAILPGSLVEVNSANKVVVNSKDSGRVPAMFALEDELQGKTIRDAYAVDEPVQVIFAQPGDEVLALIDSAFDPAIGALLRANSGGELQATASGVAQFQVTDVKFVDDAGNHRLPVRVI